MSNQRSNAADDILDVIEMAIEKAMANLRNNFVRTTIVEMTSDNSLYIVRINGAEYNVYSGCGIEFQVGDAVWVHVPDGDYKKAYICASAYKRDIYQEITASMDGAYASIDEINDVIQLLNNYATTNYVSQNYLRTATFNSTMANYDTKAQVNNKLADYVKASELDEFVTDDEVDAKLNGYAKTSDLSGYITESEVNDKLDDYQTTTAFNTAIANYVTNTSLSETLSNYATLQALANVVAGSVADLPIHELWLGDTEPTDCGDKDIWLSAAT